jgi:hypothetical protein
MLGSAMEARYSKTGVLVEGDFVSVRYDLKPEACAPGGVDHPFFLNQGGHPLAVLPLKLKLIPLLWRSQNAPAALDRRHS